MTIATVLAVGLLPVIPQPTQWMPAKGTCDMATANVSVAVCADAGLGEEGYTMKIAPGSVKIVAGGETGRVWAWQTIAQLKAAGGNASALHLAASRHLELWRPWNPSQNADGLSPPQDHEEAFREVSPPSFALRQRGKLSTLNPDRQIELKEKS